jgi:hypothetical protein
MGQLCCRPLCHKRTIDVDIEEVLLDFDYEKEREEVMTNIKNLTEQKEFMKS